MLALHGAGAAAVLVVVLLSCLVCVPGVRDSNQDQGFGATPPKPVCWEVLRMTTVLQVYCNKLHAVGRRAALLLCSTAVGCPVSCCVAGWA